MRSCPSPRLVQSTVLGFFIAFAAWTHAGFAAPGPDAAASGDVITIPLEGGPTELVLTGSDASTMHYRVQIGELRAFEVMTPEGSFTRLLVPGYHASTREGEPQLPMLNRLIEIPFGASAEVEITNRTTREIDLGDYGIRAPLMPAQPSLPKSADPATWPFVFDRQAYEVPRVAQSLAQVVDLGRLRAVRIGRLEVSPIEYLPLENRIIVTESIELEVSFRGADQAAGRSLSERTASPYFEVLYRQIEGYRDAHDDHPNPVGDIVTMVVLTPSQFEAQLEPFVQWKTERGFHVIVGVLGDPEVGTTKEDIQGWLQDLYFNATPELPAPSFVLFVGDVAQMPTWTVSGDASDRPYCDMEADLCPDILYGRFSATNATELQAILDKTLQYEQFTMPDPSYLGEVVMIAGMDGSFGPTHGNGQINYGTDNYFNAAHGIYSHTYLYPESGSHAADIVQNVSDGVAFINYTAHGSQTSWADPSFTQSQVRNLENSDQYCFAIGNCCLSSSYDVSECFAETWLRVADKGAIGYVGGSNSTLWDEDYWWGVGYRSVVVADPTYADTGPGVYDGMFHDHGEPMERWYVTNDAIIFSGNLAVMESGSSYSTYYWNIYNLMGDPSLCTWIGVPVDNVVVHPETFFTTWASVPMEAVPGSYVGLTQDGTLVGAGTVDASGAIDLELLSPLQPGTAHLVIMAQNRRPYITDVTVMVPAQVFMDPAVIPCETETEITVGVFEFDGITPKPGIEVWGEGLLYESGHALTDETGTCTITVRYDYGPSLDIVGKDPAATWELFRDPLEVQADLLRGAGVNLTNEVGLPNQAPLHLPSTLLATVPEPAFGLHALLNGTWIAGTDESVLEVTADEAGELESVIAVVGYDLFRRTFPVVEVHGTLAGHVDAAGSPGAGASIRGYIGDELVFETVADGEGNYDIGEDLVCGPYRLEVELFGYLGWDQPIFVDFGANELDVTLDPAPAGLLSGTVTELGSGAPLAATVEIYRSDTGELYLSLDTDPVDGSYSIPALPYFDYSAKVRADRHIPVEEAVSIEGPATELSFVLEPTLANLLVLDNGSGLREYEAKLDPISGAVLAPAYTDERAVKASADLFADFEALGYYVTMETVSASEPAAWSDYDLVVVSNGSDTSDLGDAAFRTALRSFVLGGGRLLIEGGEVGYNHYGETSFAHDVLHISDWNHDSSGDLTIATPSHPVAAQPNALPTPISCSYSGYGDEDGVIETSDAVRVGSWTSYPSEASLIAFSPAGSEGDGRIVYYAFNYSALDAGTRPLLLENTMHWLLPMETTGLADLEIPKGTLALRAAQPNPMVSRTAVTFDLPRSSKVDLAVYDVAGRRVKTLAAGTFPAGVHTVVWNGNDDRGVEMRSGVYFCRLSAGGSVRVEKLTRIH